MKTLFIFNGMVKSDGVVSVSGGDVRLLEIMRNNQEIKRYVMTTPNGMEFLAKYPDVTYEKAYVMPHVLSGGILDNLSISLKSFFLYKTGASEFKNGVAYSSCEHLYDILPALRLKLFHNCKWYAVYHWVEDYPWREKRGDTPLLPRYAYWLNRLVAGWIIKLFADKILAVSDQTEEKLLQIKHVKPRKIKAVYCGVNYAQIQSIVKKYENEKGKKYDAVFMKRLNYGKGVLDLLKIWKEVTKQKPDAKLAVIGDGSEEIIKQIREFLKENKMEKNVELLGVIYDTEQKFRVINSAKIFLLPTHEENWAIVIGEAMAAEVPVVVSRLKEIVPIWKDNVTWCEVGNINEFASSVTELISDIGRREALAAHAKKFIPRYDWRAIAADELK